VKHNIHKEFLALTAVVTKSSAYWDISLCSPLVSSSDYPSVQSMEATCSSETSAEFQPPTRRYIPNDRILNIRVFHPEASFKLCGLVLGLPYLFGSKPGHIFEIT
jgi:hypothetical protein